MPDAPRLVSAVVLRLLCGSALLYKYVCEVKGCCCCCLWTLLYYGEFSLIPGKTISYNLFLNSTFCIRTYTCQTSSMRRADIDNNLADADAF